MEYFFQHTAAVTMVKFANNDRTRLCCVSNDATVSICNVLSNPPSVECKLRGHTQAVTGHYRYYFESFLYVLFLNNTMSFQLFKVVIGLQQMI